MSCYIAFYKPYGVLSQFTPEGGHRALNEFDLPADVYAAGRLDHDREGLLLLTDDGALIKRLLEPGAKEKTYWVQVERTPTQESLEQLAKGVEISGYKTRPAKVKLLNGFSMPERDPPIRFRKNVEIVWLEIKITEGKNRQVRKMTAAIGHPTLRLIRIAIGNFSLEQLSLKEGEWIDIEGKSIL